MGKGWSSPATGSPIPVGCHKRAAVNALADSLVQNRSQPLAIMTIVARQLGDILQRDRNPKEKTEFSFPRFLVPHLMGYKGWASICTIKRTYRAPCGLKAWAFCVGTMKAAGRHCFQLVFANCIFCRCLRGGPVESVIAAKVAKAE